MTFKEWFKVFSGPKRFKIFTKSDIKIMRVAFNAAQQPPAQTVCSNCICEYCKFAKDTETDCGKECGNHLDAFEGRKLLKP